MTEDYVAPVYYPSKVKTVAANLAMIPLGAAIIAAGFVYGWARDQIGK